MAISLYHRARRPGQVEIYLDLVRLYEIYSVLEMIGIKRDS